MAISGGVACGHAPPGTPDERAASLVSQLTLAEEIQLVHGVDQCQYADVSYPGAARTLRGAGFIPGIVRLDIPDLNYTDGPAGVVDCGNRHVASTVFPAPIALAASWDPDLAYEVGSAVGREARAEGFAVVLNGAVNLAREPRGGRTFEYLGEDPLLAGVLVSRELRGTQDQHVVATVKHLVGNEQESGRMTIDSRIDERTLRELYLVPFQLAVEAGVGAVMCSYNKLDGTPTCEHKGLLTDILKGEWGFRGWVVSDWDATHSTIASANAGLDEEEPDSMYFVNHLVDAIAAGTVARSRLDDMVRRKLRTLITVGVIDDPPHAGVADLARGTALAQRAEEQAIVLLQNRDAALPLTGAAHTIAVIGGHADVGVLVGGGSSMVMAHADSVVSVPCKPELELVNGACPSWLGSSPLVALRAAMPGATVTYSDGHDPVAAAELARSSDVAIVFAAQWMHETADLPDLSLPDGQDALIAAVATANRRTVVVLETGTAMRMPWRGDVAAVVEAWYPGAGGADAIARVLVGAVNPSGKLPLTFPRSEGDLPSPAPPSPADVHYAEQLLIGYRWFDARAEEPLFPFGHGLSYTSFAYSNLRVTLGRDGGTVELDLKNTGARAGAEVAQVYARLPDSAGEPPQRLVAWQRVELQRGESRHLALPIERHRLEIWTGAWRLEPGEYEIHVGGSSRDVRLTGAAKL